MLKTINVKGIGRVKVFPDYVVINMNLETHEINYDKTMEFAAKQIEQLNHSLEKVGFDNKSVKTTSFNVRTDYESVKDKKGNYKRVFSGYTCSHHLKVEFDFDTKRLAKTLYAISNCLAEPKLSISFTAKDQTSVSKELLKSATTNAKEKAQILCEASGVKLGELLKIDYNWTELNIVSSTDYMMENKCMSLSDSCLSNIDIEPDDIDVTDTASFVWEIK